MQQFAIRPTLRNFNLITREKVIQLVAQCVGSGHQVDLKNYDLLIVVEIFQVHTSPTRGYHIACAYERV